MRKYFKRLKDYQQELDNLKQKQQRLKQLEKNLGLNVNPQLEEVNVEIKKINLIINGWKNRSSTSFLEPISNTIPSLITSVVCIRRVREKIRESWEKFKSMLG